MLRGIIQSRQFKATGLAFITALTLIFAAPFAARAQSRAERDARAKVVAGFNFQCATTRFPKRQLQGVISQAMRRVKDEGAWGSGERAVAYDLNGDGRDEYFVLLRTMATGDNGLWGVFSLKPARFLGIIPAEHIYPRRRVDGWAALTASWHESVSDSSITTYALRSGSYVRVAGGYEVSAYRNDEPKFAGRTAWLCERK